MNQHERIEQFTRLIEASLARGLSRRELIRRGLALGLSLPTIAAALAACGRPLTSGEASGLPTAVISRWQPPTPSAAAEPAAEPTAALPTPAPPDAPTAAAPTPTPATRFAVIGDYGLAGEPARAVAELVASWSPAFVVTTGDNNYPHGAAETIDQNVGQYYQAFIAPYSGQYGPGATEKRFFPVLGNHDWEVGYPQPYLDYFSPPGQGRYYSFAWGTARFYALDSMPGEPDGVDANSLQAQWLQAELAASTARWNIVVMHHPPFSSGLHGSSDWMRWPFGEWGAQLVLAGHDHSYERITIDGLLYIVNGLGGGARYAPGENPVADSAHFFNADHGALLVDLDERQLTLQFITRAGELVDSHQLT